MTGETLQRGLLDLTDLADKLSFVDGVHVHERSKQTIAEVIAPVVEDMLIGCRD